MTCSCKASPASTPAPAAAADEEAAGCSGGESFALRVLGDDMAPEFEHGHIIIVEPDGALKHGSYVLAQAGGEWVFRQLCQRGDGWVLHAINPERMDLQDQPLPDLGAVHGVVIQRAVPGRRKLTRFYT
jgi:SOS-response transcriptional repressor LexA